MGNKIMVQLSYSATRINLIKWLGGEKGLTLGEREFGNAITQKYTKKNPPQPPPKPSAK